MAKWRMVFLVVHGMGPQSPNVHQKFAQQVHFAARQELLRRKGDSAEAEAQVACLMDRVLLVTPNWSELFDSQASNWLISHFTPLIELKALEPELRESGDWLALRTLVRKFKDPQRRAQALREWLVTHIESPQQRLLKVALADKVNASAAKDGLQRLQQAKSELVAQALRWLAGRFPKLLLLLLALCAVAVLLSALLGHALYPHLAATLPMSLWLLLVLLAVTVVYGISMLRSKTVLLTDMRTYLALGRRTPWGALYAFGRRFEAHSISDLFLYQSDRPREQIFLNVVDAISRALRDKQVAADELLYFLPAGHSLGSVVVYDMLLGAVSAAQENGTNTAEVELAKVLLLQRAQEDTRWRTYLSDAGIREETIAKLEYNIQRKAWIKRAPGKEQPVIETESREDFLEQVARLQRRIKPLGLITFGSPIALFLFRNPELLTRSDLWRAVCPPGFYASSETPELHWGKLGLDWAWQNFWHPADFVSHRLEHFFNRHDWIRDVVEDVNVSKAEIAPAAHGVEAHSSYWCSKLVIDACAQRLADCLLAAERAHLDNIDLEV